MHCIYQTSITPIWSTQGLQIGQSLQSGAKGIPNWGKDYKSGQGLQNLRSSKKEKSERET